MPCSHLGLRGLLCVSFLISLASAATTPYGGTYYYIAPNGDDNNDGKSLSTPVKTFWRAQYLLGPGDTLLVRGGTYTDQLFVPVTDGTASQPISVQAYPGEKPVIGGLSTWGAFVIITRPYWIFDGLSYDGLLDGNYVFWVHDASHLVFRNISIKNHAGDMMILVSCEDVLVENSYFDTSGTPGDFGAGEHIWIAGSKRVVVQNSTFKRAGHAAISIVDDNRYYDHWSSNNVIRNNVIEQHWGGGIYVGNNSRANLIDGNKITYAGEEDPYTKLGIGISCPDNIVRRNIISKTGSALQALDNGLGMYAWDDGWKRQNAVDNRIYNNVVYKSANRGLYFFLKGDSQSTRNKFVNNVFYHNKMQVCDPYACSPGLEISVDSYHTAQKWVSFPNENYFFNNVVLGADANTNADLPGGGIFLFDYANWTKSLFQLQTEYALYFKGNIESNPQFTSADTGDFSLLQASKLIDAGADLTRTVSAATNTQVVAVEDARFFTDGYGVVSGDMIVIGSNAAVMVTAVDLNANTLTVAKPVSYAAGDPVNLPFQGAKPDIGAIEAGSSLSLVSGSPQSANTGKAFGAALKVKVTDASVTTMSAVSITFTAPSTGASATFNGATSVTVTPDASGVATSPVPVANNIAGAYTVTASGLGGRPVSFALTNTAASPNVSNDLSLFSTIPSGEYLFDRTSIELGLKFRSDVSGFIRGVRFYKNAADTSQHTGSLWNTNGSLLATGTFANETASGWQQLIFTNPVAITANTTYIVSYHTSSGYYSASGFFRREGFDVPPLHALSSGVDGPNGVFLYGTGFPTDSLGGTNYWVDVLFNTSAGGNSGPAPAPTPQSVKANAGTPQKTNTGASFALALQARVTDGSSNPVSGVTVTFSAPLSGASATFNNFATVTAVTNASGIATSPVPKANVNSGTYLVTATAAGLPPATFSLTNEVVVVTIPGTDKTLFGNTVPTGSFYVDGSVELGVKFRSDVSGLVKGVRFHKNSVDTGQHTGALWSADGNLLASGIFTNETTTGWQQLDFTTPVPIAANTTYVASYHNYTGFYATRNTFTNSIDVAPLHALKSGVDGANGVFKYGTGILFPNESYLDSNYWVDVVFTPDSGTSQPVPQTVTAVAGTPQSASITSSFGSALQAKVTDVSSNPVAGVQVIFTAPSSGASATFNGAASATATTNASGIAVSPVPVANAITGAYTVQASVTGLAAATFSLTNTAVTNPTGAEKSLFYTEDSSGRSNRSELGSYYSSASIELGLKFRSDTAGFIKGVRFYKSASDTGPHSGSLWAADGTLLATVAFTNETASGWQRMNFTVPVAISANTTYVVSYHTNGGYNATAGYFRDQGADVAPLHALKAGVDGPNGVSALASVVKFPSQISGDSNFWVDVIFATK